MKHSRYVICFITQNNRKETTIYSFTNEFKIVLDIKLIITALKKLRHATE